jgi:hypothetical protein
MKNSESDVEEIKISDLRGDLEAMKEEWQEVIAEDADYNEKDDLFVAVLANLEDELKGMKDTQKIEKLEIRKRARIFSDMQMLAALLDQFAMEEFEDEDFDFEDEEEEE